ARHANAPVGGHDVGREQVVADQPVLAHEPTDSAPEGQAADACRGDEPAGRGQAEELRLPIEVREGAAALRARRPAGRIDAHAAHAGEVDDEAVVAEGVPGDVVAATAHAGFQ